MMQWALAFSVPLQTHAHASMARLQISLYHKYPKKLVDLFQFHFSCQKPVGGVLSFMSLYVQYKFSYLACHGWKTSLWLKNWPKLKLVGKYLHHQKITASNWVCVYYERWRTNKRNRNCLSDWSLQDHGAYSKVYFSIPLAQSWADRC